MNSTSLAQTEYDNYTSQNMTSPYCKDAKCIFYAVTNMIIFVLGITGNGLVIWVAGFKMKKSVVTTWYLSLAISDFIFCSTLPFGVIQRLKNAWNFGRFMCKFRYFIIHHNMYNSILILVIISVDRCLTVMFPVWAQNQRTVKKASVIIIIMWIISAVLCTPAIIFREITYNQTRHCFTNYINDQHRTATVACRFIFGFIIPFHIIIICYVAIMRKLKYNHMAKSKKPIKVMTVLIVTFLICWLPYQIFSILLIKNKTSNLVKIGRLLGITLANANGFLNPFLYAFMGKDFKKSCVAVWSKIENAIQEESQDRVQGTAVATCGESNNFLV